MSIAAWYAPSESLEVWLARTSRLLRVGSSLLVNVPTDVTPPPTLRVATGSVLRSDPDAPHTPWPALECVLFETSGVDPLPLVRGLAAVDEDWLVAVTPGTERLKGRLRPASVHGRGWTISLMGSHGPRQEQEWERLLGGPVACPRSEVEERRLIGLVGALPELRAYQLLAEFGSRGARALTL